MKPSRREFMRLAAAVPLAHTLNAQWETTGTVYWNREIAVMDGFGASGAFHMARNLRNASESPRDEILDLLFSPTKGAGLSIVRNIIGGGGSWGTPLNGPTPSIEPAEGKWNWSGDEGQIWFMQEAAARGCTRYMSTVWSPPAWMKTNNNVIHGGLDPTRRQAFAEYLAAYVRGYREHHGIDIYAVSPTNEPDVTVNYSSCYWSGEELRLLVKDHIAPTFARNSIKAKLILGENSTWSEAPALPSLIDPATAPSVDIVATHAYAGSGDGNPFPPIPSRSGVLPVANRLHKTIWMTEVSAGGVLPEIVDGLYWAKLLHTHVVENGVTAWLYWWAISIYPGRGSLISFDSKNHTYVAPKRLYTIGNYSRFVRPGFVRIFMEPPPQLGNGVYLSAYKNESTRQLVLVAINDNYRPEEIRLNLDSVAASSLDVYRTSATENLAQLEPEPATGSTLALRLSGSSVTTFVTTVQPASKSQPA
jgi:glucuronoarabinoxylan endo-1,4-beta-xylanase